MAKKLGIILLFLALGSGAIAYTGTRNNGDDAPVNTVTQSTVTENSTTNDTANETKEGVGVYIDYSEEALASAEGKKVLFFHAPWCSQCRSIESGIKSDGIPAGYTIIKVDYDSNQDLRSKYNVKLQTTFVKLDENNEKIDDYVAYSEPTFEAVKREYL